MEKVPITEPHAVEVRFVCCVRAGVDVPARGARVYQIRFWLYSQPATSKVGLLDDELEVSLFHQ